MRPQRADALRSVAVWAAVFLIVAVPVVLAARSPLLAWRDPVYIAGGFAGIVAMALLLVQPLLAAGVLPGLQKLRGRRVHRWTGAALVLCIVVHVAGLWLTSPPDVIDALTFASPTPFAPWGVVAMWVLFASAALAVLRRPLRLPWRRWSVLHRSLGLVVVAGSAVHALLIEGAMEPVSKAVLCIVALAGALAVWRGLPGGSRGSQPGK